jgi:ATP-dependent RNA helicase DDX42
MSDDDVYEYRNSLEITVSMELAPKPLQTFAQAGFASSLKNEITKAGFTNPTPIQCQAIPLIMSGFDMIGLAKTGSGKTFAYVWPLITHILDQPQMKIGDGPIALILSPTRELTAQIAAECKKFTKAFNIRCCAIVGGAGKWEMTKALKER